MLGVFTKRKKSIIALLLTGTVLLNLIFALSFTSAQAISKEELDALKLQQEQLSEQRADIQEQADELNGQVDAQTQQLAVLNAKLEVTNAQLENLTEQIQLYTTSIAELENEYNLNTQTEQELLERLKVRIRVMEGKRKRFVHIDTVRRGQLSGSARSH